MIPYFVGSIKIFIISKMSSKRRPSRKRLCKPVGSSETPCSGSWTVTSMPSPSANYAHLPSTCFRIMFDHLSITDLFACAQVCQNWRYNTFIYGLTYVKELTLIIGDETHANYRSVFNFKNSHLLARGNDEKVIRKLNIPTYNISTLSSAEPKKISFLFDFLVDIFPNVNKLKIEYSYHDGPNNYEPFNILFTGYKENLTSLSFLACFGVYFLNIGDAFFNPLFTDINQLPALKHLTFDVHKNVDLGKQIDLSILTRLERFAFSTYCPSDILFDSFHKYIPMNTNLRQLDYAYNLNSPEEDLHDPATFTCYTDTEVGREVAGRFTYFNPAYNDSFLWDHFVNYDRMGFAQMWKIMPHFKSLTRLILADSFHVCHDSYKHLALLLAPLRQLSYLELFVSRFTETEKEAFEQQLPPISSTQKIPQLFSVKTLELIIYLDSHHDSNLSTLPQIFPAVQLINTKHADYALCPSCKRKGLKKVDCLQKELKTLCMDTEWGTSLKHVFYGKKKIEL